ncbi:kinase-like protein [Pluteus cervinus]|uniref:Kinase-like protein n=1 Tax=Pluteus cervinus TaxID=181527 RepID=A0ACD3AAQ7_9AGAR|nr:kinase-like protein [Pluteus cervinus]
MSAFFDLYDPLDIIGNGSFGIIRKVRRKTDGMIFARKELNFEKMSDRDRKQIVAEVNILKDLHHDNIVRYHDRHVDKEKGILYILMEYCGGGDLSGIIKQAGKQGQLLPEDTIWNYFLQILLALHQCHHPNGNGRSGSGVGLGDDGKDRRAQILHRDLKPDNVFLDENNMVKLGDFGLSKALPHASFANTYVGTPYYMSPELMQEKAYDSKSDIWSLGCLIYELCALKPPFHEAKTHAELSIFIRNGRIPPLPRGYSQALSAVIKSMLNINPAMRPSAAQLLQHERLELVYKVNETEKMLTTVKLHKTNLATRDRELAIREAAVAEKEQQILSVIGQKDGEINALQLLVGQLQLQLQEQQTSISQVELEVAVKTAVAHREEELRVLVTKREEEVAAAMAAREEEILDAVRKREAEVCQAWAAREAQLEAEVKKAGAEIDEKWKWLQQQEEELREEERKVEEVRDEIEGKLKKLEELSRVRKEKLPLEEVKNLDRQAHAPESYAHFKLGVTPKPKLRNHNFPSLSTPSTRPNPMNQLESAMKGVVFTSTGETLSTPAPTALTKILKDSPRVGLNFTKIFDFDAEHDHGRDVHGTEGEPPSPTSRKEKELKERERSKERERESFGGESSTPITSAVSTPSSSGASAASGQTGLPPTRLRRPSVRRRSGSTGGSGTRPVSSCLPSSSSGESTSSQSSTSTTHSETKPHPEPKPLSHPHLGQTSGSATGKAMALPIPRSHPSPEYDLADEENLPSPFLKRVERAAPVGATQRTSSSSSSLSSGGGTIKALQVGVAAKKRMSGGASKALRAVAAMNAVGKRNGAGGVVSNSVSDGVLMPPPTSFGSNLAVGEGSSSSRSSNHRTSNSSSSPSILTPSGSVESTRPSVVAGRKAMEEAKRVLGLGKA